MEPDAQVDTTNLAGDLLDEKILVGGCEGEELHHDVRQLSLLSSLLKNI